MRYRHCLGHFCEVLWQEQLPDLVDQQPVKREAVLGWKDERRSEAGRPLVMLVDDAAVTYDSDLEMHSRILVVMYSRSRNVRGYHVTGRNSYFRKTVV